MTASNRVILNTAVLYAKLLIVMVLGLFSVRLILGALGETDYGIYSLVAGVVGMLGVLNGAMSNASMRFMSHSLGTGDEKLITQTFNTTLVIHFIIGILVVGFIELGGFFMFDYLLNIPPDKVFDAKIVFHFMAVTTFVTIIAVPYDAVINSHENLLFLSLVDIFGAILKFGIAIYLTYSNMNLLILYGFALMLVQIIMRIIKQRYSIAKYKECKLDIKNNLDRSLAKTILSFSGWNLFGSISAMSVTQVRSVLLNMFFGVHLNAANGIAMQVTGQVNAVSSSMTRALNPQLVKSEGGGNRDRMLRLTELSTKYSVFLFALFAIPVIIEMPYLFKLWLKEVPEFAIIFSRLILIGLFIDKFTFEIGNAIRAAGKVRGFTLIIASIIILNIPISYLFLSWGYSSITVYVVAIVISVLISIIRLYLGERIINLSIKDFVTKAVVPILIPIILTLALSITTLVFVNEGIFRIFLSFCLMTIFFISTFYWIGISKDEKKKFSGLISLIINKLRNKNGRNK